MAGKVARAEQQAALMQLLSEMDPIDREIVALRIFEGPSNGEAAEALDLTKQTASKRFMVNIRRRGGTKLRLERKAVRFRGKRRVSGSRHELVSPLRRILRFMRAMPRLREAMLMVPALSEQFGSLIVQKENGPAHLIKTATNCWDRS